MSDVGEGYVNILFEMIAAFLMIDFSPHPLQEFDQFDEISLMSTIRLSVSYPKSHLAQRQHTALLILSLV